MSGRGANKVAQFSLWVGIKDRMPLRCGTQTVEPKIRTKYVAWYLNPHLPNVRAVLGVLGVCGLEDVEIMLL